MEHFHHCADAVQIVGYGAFLTFGLASSLHCLGMCGPITMLLWQGRGCISLRRVLLLYHGARVLSYTALGYGLAAFGTQLHNIRPLRALVWIVIVPLLLYALDVAWPVPKSMLRWQRRVLATVRRGSIYRQAFGLGLCSPLLPCGVLYGALAASVVAATPVIGALWMACFALGTTPLLALGQGGVLSGVQRISERMQAYILRLSALMTAVFLLWMHLRSG